MAAATPDFRLHHVGILVPDLPRAVAEYADRFGCSVESQAIEDPAQTSVVQFLRLPGAPSWLELVTPNGPDSKLANALRKGGGLNHLCYEVADIAAACAHLRDRAMLSVGDPTPAVAFGGRRVAWLMDPSRLLVELVEAGPGPLSLASLASGRSAPR